ncbi:hypothetical protein GBAR_LOCUS11806, partial [Geodia barretti]
MKPEDKKSLNDNHTKSLYNQCKINEEASKELTNSNNASKLEPHSKTTNLKSNPTASSTNQISNSSPPPPDNSRTTSEKVNTQVSSTTNAEPPTQQLEENVIEDTPTENTRNGSEIPPEEQSLVMVDRRSSAQWSVVSGMIMSNPSKFLPQIDHVRGGNRVFEHVKRATKAIFKHKSRAPSHARSNQRSPQTPLPLQPVDSVHTSPYFTSVLHQQSVYKQNSMIQSVSLLPKVDVRSQYGGMMVPVTGGDK